MPLTLIKERRKSDIVRDPAGRQVTGGFQKVGFTRTKGYIFCLLVSELQNALLAVF